MFHFRPKAFNVFFFILCFQACTDAVKVSPQCSETPYNFSFLRAENGNLYTPRYKFKTYGSPSITHDKEGTTVHLTRYGQYIELPNHGLECIQDMTKCQDGFTLSVDIRFHRFEQHKMYIFTSGGDLLNHTGIAMYVMPIRNLTCAAKHDRVIWTSLRRLTVGLEEWHTYLVSWNSVTGFRVYLDGNVFLTHDIRLPTIAQPVSSSLLIAKGASQNTTLMDIRNLFVWTSSRDKLEQQGCDVEYKELLHSSDDSGGPERILTLDVPYWMKCIEIGIVSSVTLIIVMSMGCICHKCCICLAGVRENEVEEEKVTIVRRKRQRPMSRRNLGQCISVTNKESLNF